MKPGAQAWGKGGSEEEDIQDISATMGPVRKRMQAGVETSGLCVDGMRAGAT